MLTYYKLSNYSRYLPMPDYDKSDNDTVVLTLPGTVIDENYSLLLLENSDIDLATTVLLDKVQKGKSIGDEAIKMLRKKGLIEGRKPTCLHENGDKPNVYRCFRHLSAYIKPT